MAALDLSERLRRRVQVLVDSHLASPEAHEKVAIAARATLASLIGTGLASPVYRRFVDGIADAPEEAVRLDGGVIRYRFSFLAVAAAFALAFAINRSPIRSGRYREGWFFLVDGVPWTDSLADIKPGSIVVLTNAEPYHRKIDTGGEKTSVPPGIVEDTRQAVRSRFPSITAQRAFVMIPGGYILKGRARRSGSSFTKKGGWIVLGPSKRTARKDSKAGEPLTYPAVIMSEVAL